MGAGQFSYINAKLRARLTGRLRRDQFDALLHASSMEEALVKLKNSNYAIFYESYEKMGDLRLAEMAMAEKEIDLFTGLRSGLSGPAHDFIDSLLMSLEVKNIKILMGSWFSHTVLGRPSDLSKELFLRKIILTPLDYDQLLNANDFDAFVLLFSKSPYYNVLLAALDQSKKERTLFAMDLALDHFYYAHLRGTIVMLQGDSRLLASTFFGAEIDFENLISKLRYADLKASNDNSLYDLVIKGGNHITEENIDKIVSSSAAIKAFLQDYYPTFFNAGTPDRRDVELVENCRDLELTARSKALRGKQPFSVASSIAYFYLMKNETNRIITILEGHHYGLSEEKIREVLCL